MEKTFDSLEKLRSLERSGYLTEPFRLFHIKDQTLRDFSFHYHDFHKIVVFLSGRAVYHIEGKAYRLKPWDILLVSRHSIHKPEIDVSRPYERFIFWLRADVSSCFLPKGEDLCACFQKADDRSFNLIRLNSGSQELLKDTLYRLEHSMEDTQASQYGASMLKNALFIQFMVYLNRIFLEKSYVFDQKAYTCDSQIEDLLRYINRHLNQDLSVDALAEKYYFSKYHMMRKFKEETGYTLHNYIVNKRLLLARSLILAGEPVMKAARQSGFCDYTTFVRAYKKQFHTTPSQKRPPQSPLL